MPYSAFQDALRDLRHELRDRGHYELAIDASSQLCLATAFTEFALAM